jgi:predicted Zn-dependent protease
LAAASLSLATLLSGCAGRGRMAAPAADKNTVAADIQRGPGTPARAPEVDRQNEHSSPSGTKLAGLVALEEELARAMKELRKSQEIPPYFIGYEVHDQREIEMAASDGALLGSTDHRNRVLTTDVRVGDRALDSSHALQSMGFDFDELGSAAVFLPLDDAAAAIKAVAWAATDKRYKGALERFLKIRAQKKLKVADDDPSDDFSAERPVTFIEPPATITVDASTWEERIRRVSARLAAAPDIRWSQVRLEVKSVNRWLANSEGSSIQTGRNFVRVFLQASVRADDGMDMERHESFDGATIASLPDESAMVKAVDAILADLRTLRRAPLAEPFVGPAILEGKAAAVFFHEIFGHRVEGHRQKKDDEGQTFAKKIGEAVMPSFVSVYDDPSLVRIGRDELNGFYRFDDEGVPAQPASLVDGGVLKGFLMGRSPTRHFSKSNGHGRRQEGHDVVARQGNLVVQPTLAVPVDELRQRLRDEARRQGKPYGLLFRDISGGFTNTGRTGPQAFKVLPILVYRVWVDGRPDELLRGVDLVGTPLTALSKIMAASDDYQTFNGYCGAESGFLPVSATSPSLLVQQIEVERKEKGSEKPPVLPSPPTSATALSGEEAVRQAMQDELSRTLSDIHVDGQPSPYFAAFTVNDGDYVQVSATLGALTSDFDGRTRTVRTDVRVGDPSFDNSNFSNAGFHGFDGGGLSALPLDDDYRPIRRALWFQADEAYKRAAQTLGKKKAAAGSQAAGDEDKVPDFSSQAPSTTILLPTVAAPASAPLRQLTAQLSGLFQSYPTISSSHASAMHVVGRQRYLGTDGTWADERDGFVRVDISASTQAGDGMQMRDSVAFTAASVATLPSSAAMEKAVRGLADELGHQASAAVATSGDAVVLFEGPAASQIIKRLLADRLSGTPLPKVAANAFAASSTGMAEELGQHVTAPLLSIYDDPKQQLGPGKQILLGSYAADDEGVPAQRVSLVESGVLKALLMSRTPSKQFAHSNGHGRAFRGGSVAGHIGNLFVTAKGGLARKALLDRLAKESKAKHCDAYIVRLINDLSTGGAFDVADITDQIASLYAGRGTSVQPLVAFRLRDGKEEPVRGFTVEGLLPKALKDIVAAGNEPFVLNFIDGFAGMGLPSTIVSPPLLFTNLEVRQEKARHRKPPLYPHPSFAATGPSER